MYEGLDILLGHFAPRDSSAPTPVPPKPALPMTAPQPHSLVRGGDAPPPKPGQHQTRATNRTQVPHTPAAPPEQRVPTTAPEQRVPTTAPEQRVPTTAPEQRVPTAATEHRVPAVPPVPSPRRSTRPTKGTRLTTRYGAAATRRRQRRYGQALCAHSTSLAEFTDALARANATLDQERGTAHGQVPKRERVKHMAKDRAWFRAMIATKGARLTSKDTNRFLAATFRLWDDDAKAKYTAFTAQGLDEHGQPLKWSRVSKGPNGAMWEEKHAEEFDRLIEETETMEFMPEGSVPAGKRATYYNPQCEEKMKPEGFKRRVRGTVGGNNLSYQGGVSAWTADLMTIKLFLNATVSEDADWMTLDIKDFYLGTPMDEPEYMWIRYNQIPLSTQKKYGIYDPDPERQRTGSVLVKIKKGMYGLKQAGKLAQARLIAHLAAHGYMNTPEAPCMFRHQTRNIAFVLVVDDFGIKYKGKEHVEHLIETLRKLYKITFDWEGKKYVGLTITKYPDNEKLDISLPGYISKACERMGITEDSFRRTNSPITYQPPRYGKEPQLNTVDESPLLDPDGIHEVQTIVGILLFYGRAVDYTLLPACNMVGSRLGKGPTEAVLNDARRMLYYAATWPDARVTFYKSDMRLIVHSDGSHLSETGARSRAGGFLFCGNYDDDGLHNINGGIECVSTILPTVTASAAETEYASCFINATTAEAARNILNAMGYPQKATPIIVDNQCAQGICNNTVKQRRSKAIDMRYHWIRDRVAAGHFTVLWFPGHRNLADFFTKAHSAAHHLEMRKYYVSYGPATKRPTRLPRNWPIKTTKTAPERVCCSNLMGKQPLHFGK